MVVLEQGTEAKYACNTRYSGGLLHVAFKDMQASPVAITAAIGKHDHDHCRQCADACMDCVRECRKMAA